MFHVFLLCDKPSRSSSGSNLVAATIKKALRIQGFLLFYPESGMGEYDTHTLEMVLFCKTAQNRLKTGLNSCVYSDGLRNIQISIQAHGTGISF